MPLYKATKDGWDGRKIIKAGTIFKFEGLKGLWMVEVDSSGKVIGEELPQRPVRAGASAPTGRTREQLREQLRKLGIKFHGTAGALELAEMLRKYNEGETEEVEPKEANQEVEQKGVGNQDVI